MEINPVHPVNLNAPVTTGWTSVDVNVQNREIVAAVNSLNQSEMLGQGRELAYRRDPKTGRLIIQIRQKGTGELIDQIPPEVLLHMAESLEQKIKGGVSEE